MAQTILICEDDAVLATTLQQELSDHGYEVQAVSHGADALEQMRQEEPALLLLDLLLPDMDGLDVCRRLRAYSLAPVILMSGRGGELDRVVGLEVGADDYLAKPFGMKELLARVEARLRRDGEYARMAAPFTPLLVGDLSLDCAAHSVTVAGRALHLTPKEFDLLWSLARERGRTVSAAQLLLHVWGYDSRIRTRTLDVHVGRLRAKIEPDPRRPQRLLTVPGRGYRLVAVNAAT